MNYKELLALDSKPGTYGTLDPLETERLRQLRQQQERRRVAHANTLMTGGNSATTQRNKLGMAKALSYLTAAVGGSMLGGTTAGIAGLFNKDEHAPTFGQNFAGGAALGAIGGVGANAAANVLARILSSVRHTPRPVLKQQLNNLDITTALIPGRAQYLSTQLDKDFQDTADAEYKPEQLVY